MVLKLSRSIIICNKAEAAFQSPMECFWMHPLSGLTSRAVSVEFSCTYN